ncbi:hypothetical protein SKAU_G00215410 [Synaphobranchus kaupii]|uniref:Gypsy retrotransposon integrase-like protein 1 n=1 Tax=Synaphobranchus kaupii TaxID=118154 RepID=A0A9Q1IUZ3_SYNKA|nr:hypothetical protein SKAU_G00215410 [Synaphobranchus kaupii]
MVGKGLFTLSVGGRSVRSSVWVARVQDPCILGLDFLRSTGAVLDLGNGTLSFPGGPTVGMLSPAHLAKPQLQPVKAAEPDSVSTTPLGARYASPAPLPHYLHSAPLNMRVKDYSLAKRRASPVRRSYPPATPAAHPSTSPGPIPLAQLPQMGEEERLSAVREIWRKNCDGLEPQQQEALWRLLLEFKDIFALTEEDVGQTHLVQHDSITGDAQPVKMRPRRLPLARQEAADKALWEMQQAGIIEPSDSPWASPVVMVPKKGGKWRFCVDYRRLNEVGPGGERVVAYYSRTFDKAERRYCVTRRELLAVVLAIRHFKYYLCGLHFTVRTEHSALQWLMSFKEPEGQVARWIEELQSYHFSVVHRAGARHTNADALSRRPCAADGCHYCERREARESELCAEGEACAVGHKAGEPVCRTLQVVDADEWRLQQEQDIDIRPVLQWVEAQQRPLWEEVAAYSPATKALWSKFGALRMKDGVLERAFRTPATGEERWQVVVPKALREIVLESNHGAVGAGHFGVSKTLRRLRQGFYWSQHKRDVEDFCRRCDRCTARKGPPGQSQAELQQFPVGAPMERVGIDVMGPFPLSDRGNRYVLTAMDYFSKWPEAYALPDQEAETIVDALVGGMISRFGAPDVIHSDQGRNFESRVFTTMCERLNIHKTRTTPLHPQSDGLVERFNRTMGQQLAIVTAKHQRDWDRHIPLVLMAYRSAVQDSTSCTPALLMLGRELRTPAEMAFGRAPDTPAVPPGPEYARRLQDRLETAHAFARKQMENAGVRQKRNFDVRMRGRHFQAGELVWVHSPQRKRGRCPKLDSHWMGPCRVLERIGEVMYRVQLPPRGRKVALHRDRLAPYRGSACPAGTPETLDTPLIDPDMPPAHAHTHGPLPTSPVPQRNSPGLDAEVPVGPVEARPPPHASRRHRRPPGRFRDFIVPSGTRDFGRGGAV